METSIEQIPTTSQLQLTIHVSANVSYSATAARRIVGRFAVEEIGYLLRTGEPTLVVSDRVRWHVSPMTTLPPRKMMSGLVSSAIHRAPVGTGI